MLSNILPQFGEDLTVVGGYCTEDQPIVARVFLPLDLVTSGGTHFQSWSTASSLAGVELTGTTRWRDLHQLAGRRGNSIGKTQFAAMPAGQLNRLVAVLSSVAPRPERVGYALWAGYAGDLDEWLMQATSLIGPDAPGFLKDGSFYKYVDDLGWAASRSLEDGMRLPAAIWDASFNFVLASPLYHDSFYLTCSDDVFQRLREMGIELIVADRDAVLASEEVWQQ